MLISFPFASLLLFSRSVATFATATLSPPTGHSFGLRGKNHHPKQKRFKDESHDRKLTQNEQIISSHDETTTSTLSPSYSQSAEEDAFSLSNLPKSKAIPLQPFMLSFQFDSSSIPMQYDLDALIDVTSKYLREYFYLHDDSCVDVTLHKSRRRRRRERRLQEKSNGDFLSLDISFEGVATFISDDISVTNTDVHTWQKQAFTDLALMEYHDTLQQNHLFLYDNRGQHSSSIEFTTQYSEVARPNDDLTNEQKVIESKTSQDQKVTQENNISSDLTASNPVLIILITVIACVFLILSLAIWYLVRRSKKEDGR